MLVSMKPAWFIASYAMPPVIAPSPMTAMQWFFRFCGPQSKRSDDRASRSCLHSVTVPRTWVHGAGCTDSCCTVVMGFRHVPHLEITADRHAQRC